MSDQPAVSKAQLLEGLKSSRDEILARVGDLPAKALEAGCYENGWNARQVLAHVAAIEWSYPRLIEIARNGPPPEKKKEERAESRPARGGINSYNDRQIERYAGYSVGELLDVFKTNRETTIAAIEAADEDLFAREVKSAGGITGTLATVLNYVAVMHVRMHIDDVLKAAAESKA